jgi:hypothetical protein
MKEHQFRGLPAVAGNALNFESVPLHADREIVSWVAALRASSFDRLHEFFSSSRWKVILGYPVISTLHRIYKIS